MAKLCSFLLFILTAFAACSSGHRPSADPEVPIRHLMAALVDPSADVVWGAAGTVIDHQGVRDLAPKTEREWENVRHGAIRLVEAANSLLLPGRPVAAPGEVSLAPGVELEPEEVGKLIKKNRKVFNGFVIALKDHGLAVIKATHEKDAEALFSIGEKMEHTCEGCHKTFWYPDTQAFLKNPQELVAVLKNWPKESAALQ